MTDSPLPEVRAAQLTDQEKIEWVSKLADRYRLTHEDIARYSGYKLSSVDAWFCHSNSSRYRPIPERAFDRLVLEYKAGRIRQGNR